MTEERPDIRITLQGDPQGKELIVADQLFQTAPSEWLTSASLPQRPLPRWQVPPPLESRLVDRGLPIIYGREVSGGGYHSIGIDGKLRLGLDVFGSAFFMLTRYEELVNPVRDLRDRFPAHASLAFLEGFLTRPIVNEYLEVLWWGLSILWPRLVRRGRSFTIRPTHDVDRPLSVSGIGPLRLAKITAGDLVRRRSARLAAHRIRAAVEAAFGHYDGDPNNTFDLIMDFSERKGLKSAFYFIAGHTAGRVDGEYTLQNPWIRQLLRKISDREHEIGLHPSYHTFRDVEQLKREFENLLRATGEGGIRQNVWGGRQHYLRWQVPITWEAWESAGLHYDSSLSFADHAGFRCGVCYEYPVFSLGASRELDLTERPLIVMEQSVLEYMKLAGAEAYAMISLLKERCRMFGGDFTILWHNNSLLTEGALELYEAVLG